jgi:O-antigen/teichoic acid export membrane protein
MIQRLKVQLKNKHFLSLSSSVISSGCGMLTFVLLLRSMKIDQMGYWIFFQTTLTLLDTFRSGFLQTAMIKFYSGAERKKAQEVLGSIWYLAVIITVFWFIVTIPGLLLVPYIDNISIKLVIKWIAVIFLLTLPSSISSWRLQSDHKFNKLLFLNLLNQVGFIVVIICLMLFKNMNITNLFFGYGISCLITSTTCLILKWSGIKSITKRTKIAVREVYHFGKFSVGTSISTNLLRSSDIYMINFFLGPALVPVYNVAQRLMELVEIPLRSFLATGMPEISTAFNQKRSNDVVQIMQKYSGMLTLLLIPAAIVGVLLANVGVSLLGGGKYSGTDAANVFRIFIILSIVYPIDRFTGVTLDIIHQPKRNFIKVIIMLVVNVVANYLGILIFGNLFGVAVSTVLSFVAGFSYGYLSLKTFLPFNMPGILNTGYKELKPLLTRIFI